MTKEELKKEAIKYVKQNYCEICVMADDCKSGCIDCFTVQAYLAGAEPREKRIADLKEKVKWYSEQVCFKECAEVWGKSKELLKWFVWYFREGSLNLVPYKHKVAEAEQFLNSEVGKNGSKTVL